MLANSWKSNLLIVALVCGQGAVFGQQLHLKARTIDTGRTSPGNDSKDKAEARIHAPGTRPVHQIVQFDHLPGVEDLNALLAAGFKIVGAVPDNAVMVIAQSAVTVQVAGVKWTGSLEVSDKISPSLGAAGSENAILAIVEFHADVEADAQQAIATEEGVTFSHPAKLLPQHVIVSASMKTLEAIAAHDEVAYIFPADPVLLDGNLAGSEILQCAGMLTLSGPIAQYANVANGWDLDSDHIAHLSYVFGALTSKVPASSVESEILRALNAWSTIANVTFQAGSSATAVRTIFMEFASGAHGDAYPFDSAGTILAHTFYPVPLNAESLAGDMHLNADVNWHVGGDIDIYSVVLHELGHAIGLTHSDNPGDVMYPYYRRGAQLSANDIGAARQLYGAPGTTPSAAVPTPTAPQTSAASLALTINPVTAPGQAAQVTITGTVSGGTAPLTLQYQTDHGYTGTVTVGSLGTWSATVSLVTGTNTVTVTAFDSAKHTASQSVTVTRTAAAASTSTAPVSIQITTPSSAVTTANGTTISVGGTSSGGNGITQVTWQTSAGASGTAVGTGQWLASNIPLLTGTNTILVRAFDAAGASAWASVVVNRQ